MEIKLNTGTIFKNDYKKDGDKLPDYKGKINVDGKIKEVALWVNKPEGGKSYFGVKISDEYVKPDDTTSEKPQPEDDLPF